MIRFHRCRDAVCVMLVSALLAGCVAASKLQAVPSTVKLTRPDAPSKDLLYLNENSVVHVYDYPSGKPLSPLKNLSEVGGLCADLKGHVFITTGEGSRVFEYRDGTKPIEVLNVPFAPISCAVDPITRDLAVSGAAGVAVFPYNTETGYQLPVSYDLVGVSVGRYCGYDDVGNLFVDGTSGPRSVFALTELRKGASNFKAITVTQRIAGPGFVQWDGQFIAIGDSGASSRIPATIYRFSISGTHATVRGQTTLNDSDPSGQFWIQEQTIIGALSGSESGAGFWSYPKGGTAQKALSGRAPFGVAIGSK